MAETHAKKHHHPLVRRVARTVAQFGMFELGEKVLLGVSGGPDSMALLHAIRELAPVYGLHLAVAHLNHGLRPQAAESEAAFVQRQAKALGLACHMEKAVIDPRQGSLEERAREARYAFFERIRATYGYTKIALGHQADDNAEAVLLHLLRGSGLRGLAGIPPVRGHGIVRPLIQLRRSEILEFLKARHIPFVEDSSNSDPRFKRNRIRHHLLPLLQRDYNPNLVVALNRTATLCRDEEAWLGTLLQPFVEKAITRMDSRSLELSIDSLKGVPRAAQRRLLREALRRWRGDLRRVSADHIEALMGLILPERPCGNLDLPGPLSAQRTGHSLLFMVTGPRRGAIGPAAGTEFSYRINSSRCIPMEIDIPEAGCRMTLNFVSVSQLETLTRGEARRVLFDMDEISFPLVVRNLRPGDRLSPYGMAGTQKLKKIFIDRKITRAQRPRIPLLVSQDGILWVAGVRRSAMATLSAATTRALQVAVYERKETNGQTSN